MSRRTIGRIILAVVAGYIANGILVVVTEQLFASRATHSLHYFVVDLISQCVYTVIGGYLCRVIAGSHRAAMAGLIGLGVLVGTVSLVTSWHTEPHWYGIALLAVFPPCVWVGWRLKAPASRQQKI